MRDQVSATSRTAGAVSPNGCCSSVRNPPGSTPT
jgi:hypothetical protein